MFKEKKEHNTLIYGIPKIRVYYRALQKMWRWVQACDIEVGWFGLADMCKDGNILISDVFLPRQECHAATTEINPEGLEELALQLMAEDDALGIPVESPDYRVNKLLFWGHSHVNMGVTGSPQDDEQMRHFAERDWYVRGIFNKKGEVEFQIYYFKTGFIIKDAAWESLDDPGDEGTKLAEQEVKDRVTRMGSSYLTGGTQQNWDSYYGSRNYKRTHREVKRFSRGRK